MRCKAKEEKGEKTTREREGEVGVGERKRIIRNRRRSKRIG
jgi:hypothetical protein